MQFVITIDGPTASGKGTLARKIATHLGYACLDTGLLYRAVGMSLTKAGLALQNEEAAVAAAQTLDLTQLQDDASIRTAEAGQAASVVASYPRVRQALLQLQRDFAQNPPHNAQGAVLDGRDIGTVICPEAPLKLYVTATAEARAERRFKELQARGSTLTYAQVLADIQARDDRDMNRATAPLKPAPDAVIIDSSAMNADAVFTKALDIINSCALCSR